MHLGLSGSPAGSHPSTTARAARRRRPYLSSSASLLIGVYRFSSLSGLGWSLRLMGGRPRIPLMGSLIRDHLLKVRPRAFMVGNATTTPLRPRFDSHLLRLSCGST